MGTDPSQAASDPVSTPAEEAMPHDCAEDAGLPVEVEQAISQVLGAQPGLPIPPSVRDRIVASLRSEAATRAALVGNDVEPLPSADPFAKSVDPVLDAEDLR